MYEIIFDHFKLILSTNITETHIIFSLEISHLTCLSIIFTRKKHLIIVWNEIDRLTVSDKMTFVILAYANIELYQGYLERIPIRLQSWSQIDYYSRPHPAYIL